MSSAPSPILSLLGWVLSASLPLPLSFPSFLPSFPPYPASLLCISHMPSDFP